MDLPFIKQLKGNLAEIHINKFLIVNNGGSVEQSLLQSEKYEVNSLKEVLSYTRLNSKEETIERHYLKFNQYSQNPEQDIVWINHEGQAKQFLIRYDIYSNQQVEEIFSSMERKNLGNFVTPGTLDSGVICRVVITDEDNTFFIFGNTYANNGLPIKSDTYDLNRRLVLYKEYSYDEHNRPIEVNVKSRTGRCISKTTIEYNQLGCMEKFYAKGILKSIHYQIPADIDESWRNEFRCHDSTIAVDLRVIESDMDGNPITIKDYVFSNELHQFGLRYVTEIGYDHMSPTYEGIRWQSKYLPTKQVDEYGYGPDDYIYSAFRKAYKADQGYNLDGTRKYTNKRSCRACTAYRGNNRCTCYPNTQLHEDWGCCNNFNPIIEYRMSHFWYNEELLRRLGLYEIAASRYSDRYKSERARRIQDALAFKEYSQITGKSIKQLLEEQIGI